MALVSGGVDILCEKKFIWKLKNFDALKRRSEFVGAQKFTFEVEATGGFSASSWDVYLKPVTTDSYNKPRINLQYELKNGGNSNGMLTQVEAEISRENGEVWRTIKSRVEGPITYGSSKPKDYRTLSLGLFWGNDADKHEGSSEPPLNTDGSLTLHVTWRLFQVSPTVNPPTIAEMKSKKRSTKRMEKTMRLSNDLLKVLLNSNGNHDVTLVSKDGKEFKAHKAILAARSPVFMAMFSGDTKEAKSGEVKVDDISSKGLKVMLHYIYSGELNLNEEDDEDFSVQWLYEEDNIDLTPTLVNEEILYLSQKYELKELIDYFDETFGENCDPKDALFLLQLANKYSLKNAENRILQQVKSNPSLLGDCFEKLYQNQLSSR